MKIIPIEDGNTRFDLVKLVEVQCNNRPKLYPYCAVHGAMNKVSIFKDKPGGFWRCCTAEGIICRAGCIQE